MPVESILGLETWNTTAWSDWPRQARPPRGRPGHRPLHATDARYGWDVPHSHLHRFPFERQTRDPQKAAKVAKQSPGYRSFERRAHDKTRTSIRGVPNETIDLLLATPAVMRKKRRPSKISRPPHLQTCFDPELPSVDRCVTPHSFASLETPTSHGKQRDS